MGNRKFNRIACGLLPGFFTLVSSLGAGPQVKRTTDFAQDRTPQSHSIVPIQATEIKSNELLSVPKETKPNYRSAYGTRQTIERTPMPIDLLSALQLADASNPTIGIARARVREAQARLNQAEVLWLPNLTVGTTYYRHDGQTQNQRGEVFGVSRSNLFGGGGAQLRVDVSDAIYLPLVARRLVSAEASNARAVSNNIQLDVAIAYLDLVQIYGLIAINTDTLFRAEQMLNAAQAGDKAGMNRSASDVNRARTEVKLRRQERYDLQARAGVASARLTRLLLLDPTIDLQPAESQVVPLTLVPTDNALEDLIDLALRNRPETSVLQSQLSAAETRVRQARMSPLIPKVQLDYLGGTFGGGRNANIGTFDARGDFNAQVFWELRNLGFGNRAQIRERSAQLDQVSLNFQAIQAQISAEVTESAKIASAKIESLEDAQDAVKQGLEMYRKISDATFGMAGPRQQFEVIDVLLAIQALNQSRVQYLNAIIDHNRAQFRLFTALGEPVSVAPTTTESMPLEVPSVPTKPVLEKKK